MYYFQILLTNCVLYWKKIVENYCLNLKLIQPIIVLLVYCLRPFCFSISLDVRLILYQTSTVALF